MTIQGRRFALIAGTSTLGLAIANALGWMPRLARAAEAKFEVTHTDEQWHKLLTPNQYDVLRKEGTERPYSSPLNDEHRDGMFACAGCSLDAFTSKTKFDSGTGWPSFWQPLPNAVGQTEDRTWGMVRTEVHCRRCGGHLGHVFDDGPTLTRLRYCVNSAALKLKPTDSHGALNTVSRESPSKSKAKAKQKSKSMQGSAPKGVAPPTSTGPADSERAPTRDSVTTKGVTSSPSS